MIEFRGRLIPENLEELVDPKRTALLVVDVQNDFCSEGGVWHRQGKFSPTYKQTINNIKWLLDEARKSGVLVLYSLSTHLPDFRGDTAVSLRTFFRYHGVKETAAFEPYIVEDTWGHQFVDDVKPKPGDLVFKKTRANAFLNSYLDTILRANAISNLVITGVLTEACVEATAREASYRDYFSIVITDCVDSYNKEFHEMALKYMKSRLDCATSREVGEIWRHQLSNGQRQDIVRDVQERQGTFVTP
ncbi:MAG: cysteine hydrolase [Thaumarchaeota archaeon]|nr:cysteine hydrolase [Nitrososphaerota archaeon]